MGVRKAFALDGRGTLACGGKHNSISWPTRSTYEVPLYFETSKKDLSRIKYMS